MKRGVKMYYPDEVIDDIVSGNDIVDVIGSYVQLKKQVRITYAFVLSTERNHLLFTLTRQNSFFIVLAVMLVVT